MEVILKTKDKEERIKCPNLRNNRGQPDMLAIRHFLRQQGMNHRGYLRVA